MMEKIQLNQGVSPPPMQTFRTDIEAVDEEVMLCT